LLTPAHIEVALYDQQERGYRLGDILAMRGWVKEEIIEWVVQNKLLPERQVQEEDFDTLLISLKEVLEQKESEQQDSGAAEDMLSADGLGTTMLKNLKEILSEEEEEEKAKEVESPSTKPWRPIPPPPPPRQKSPSPKPNPGFLEVAERETLIIEGD
jgi:hypothetical protein